MYQYQFLNQKCSRNLPDQHSALQNYLKQIDQIKNKGKPCTSKSPLCTLSNFVNSANQIKETIFAQSIYSKAPEKKFEKKRCLSVKSSIQTQIFPVTTFGNQKNQNQANARKLKPLAQSGYRQKLILKKNLTFMEKVNRNVHKAMDNSSIPKKLLTEPSQSGDFQLSLERQLNLRAQQKQLKFKNKLENLEKAKNQVIKKLHFFILEQDKKGEEELNQMLFNDYRKKIKFHNEAYRYEQKIKEMIKANKLIAQLLKSQLLTEKQNSSHQTQNNQSPTSLQNQRKKTFSQLPQTEHQDLEINCQLDQNKINLSILEVPKLTKQATIQELQQTKQILRKFDYQNQVHNSTQQFVAEWGKEQFHKRSLYQKFRSTIFNQFPDLKDKSRQLKTQPNNESGILLTLDDSDSFAEIKTFRKDSQSKEARQSQESTAGKKIFISNIQKQKKYQQNPLDPFNSQQNLLSKKDCKVLEKTLKLSKKNSTSKASIGTLDLLSSQEKQEMAKINFKNLIEFIFKRAFFYSVSKKKVIQNEVQYEKIRQSPTVSSQKSSISFLAYNSSSTEKRNLKLDKFNKKKIKATGNYLIRNKFKIMNLEKEGKKSFEILKKCLDEAIEDYILTSKLS